MSPPLARCSKARVSRLTALELESLSSGLQKDTHSFYHLLTFLPSPYFIGDKVKVVSVKVPMTLKLSNFSEHVKSSQIQGDNPHTVKQFFCFLNLISCLTSFKKYVLSQTELTVHSKDIWLPLLKQVRIISSDSSESLYYCLMMVPSKEQFWFFLFGLQKISPATSALLSRDS